MRFSLDFLRRLKSDVWPSPAELAAKRDAVVAAKNPAEPPIVVLPSEVAATIKTGLAMRAAAGSDALYAPFETVKIAQMLPVGAPPMEPRVDLAAFKAELAGTVPTAYEVVDVAWRKQHRTGGYGGNARSWGPRDFAMWTLMVTVRPAAA